MPSPTVSAPDQPPGPGVPDDDALLLVAVGRGEDHALRVLVEKWKTPLVNFIWRSVGDLATAEDLAQTVFIKLWRNAPRYRPEAKFATYLFTLARTVIIDEYRRRGRRPVDATDPAEMLAVHSDETGRRITELEEAFGVALDTLPENQRTALLLWKQQELSYDDIARTMGASVTAVKTWIFRGRQRLRESLAAFLPGA